MINVVVNVAVRLALLYVRVVLCMALGTGIVKQALGVDEAVADLVVLPLTSLIHPSILVGAYHQPMLDNPAASTMLMAAQGAGALLGLLWSVASWKRPSVVRGSEL